MNFIILDLEATCWQGNDMNRTQEIIELAAYSVNGYREWVDSFQRFIKPVQHPRLSTYCMELTTITQDQVSKAKIFEHVFPLFQEWLEGHDQPQLICTWGAKDMEIIKSECKAHDIDDTSLPDAINLKSQYADFQNLGKEVGLQKALEFTGIEFEGTPHRAIDDAYNTAQLFLHYLDQWRY
jgi:inhibitor of KinA sporulation pathway (predicted exonuclease)